VTTSEPLAAVLQEMGSQVSVFRFQEMLTAFIIMVLPTDT
jgi:hypothetical protein